MNAVIKKKNIDFGPKHVHHLVKVGFWEKVLCYSKLYFGN